jgi:uncharacterized membrane protein YidH (DUF202 family)
VSEQYFIRVRGKVQGPFDADKLRQLARRGQFSRLHEISTDAQQWLPAKNYPDLFATPVSYPETSQAVSANAVPQTAPLPAANGAKSPSVPARQEVWYYAVDGNQGGPIDFLSLSSMIGSGQFGLDTPVWRDGMPDWVPAHTVPGMVSATTSTLGSRYPNVDTASAPKKDEVGGSIARVLDESRPWVIFIAVMAFLYSGTMLVMGLLQLIVGSRSGVMPMAAGGMGQMVMSVVVGVGGYLLTSFSGGIARFDRSRHELSLQEALQTLKIFWTYVGIVLIVLLALIVIFFIIMFATIGSIPNFN